MLNSVSGDIWKCTNSRGGYCYAPVWCKTFNGDQYASWNYTDYGFKIYFDTNETYYTKIPLTAVMRNGDDPDQPRCNLLIYQT